MVRHITTGVEAVVDSARVVCSDTVWVDTCDVPKALQTIGKLTGANYPEATVYQKAGSTRDRVAIEL